MKSHFILFLIFISMAAHAQDRPNEWYPPRNKPCPDFTINNIQHYSQTTISNKSLKGKWYVLDFWSSHCRGCMASFPKMDSMSKKFQGKVDFFLVGIGCIDPPANEKQRLDSIYQSHSKERQLTIPYAAALDLGKKWHLCMAPDIVIVDDKGIVRAHTYHIKASQVDSLLQGQQPHFDKFPGEIEY